MSRKREPPRAHDARDVLGGSLVMATPKKTKPAEVTGDLEPEYPRVASAAGCDSVVRASTEENRV